MAAKIAVNAPITATTVSEVSEWPKRGYILATRNTPAATMVAACISALMGVGPSMASGSHVWSGNWADFPMAPKNNPRVAHVSAAADITPVAAA